jgi:DNA-binding transcriptional MerR regulator
LEHWASGAATDATMTPLFIGETAKLLDVTTDMLRNWERNGLIAVPRDPRNDYRLYSPSEIGRLRVIRMLLRAGYSMMSILRMLLYLDQGRAADLRQVLDTPRPDEDIHSAADRWLSTLVDFEQRASDLIAQLEVMIDKQQTWA